MSKKGYISEIFSSFQGEGGSVKGSCMGKRQIFIRFYGCNLVNQEYGSAGCIWCDSGEAQRFHGKKFEYEGAPGSEEMQHQKNPVNPPKIIPILQSLQTPDLHSVSFTGGEPLAQLPFLLELAKTLKEKLNVPLYLETNGSILPKPETLKQLGKLFSYCCCDVKDRSARAAVADKWESLVETELNFINSLVAEGVQTFAKIVVTEKTEISDIEWICQKLAKIRYPTEESVGLAIQPVHLLANKMRETYGLSKGHLFGIFQAAANHLPLESLSLSVQTHKYLNIL